MAKVELKTQKNDASVDTFLASVADEQQRRDSQVIRKMMEKASGEPAVMWGSAIIGFGTYDYVSPGSGREADWMRIGFSPRKGKITLYFMDGFDHHKELLSKLGKHTISKGCLYIKRLEDVDTKVLQQLITNSYKHGIPIGSQ